jgi:glycogen debranching enzyme
MNATSRQTVGATSGADTGGARATAEERERKQRILTHGTPSITTSIADAVVIKSQNVFFLTQPDGDVPLEEGHGFGLYYHDCRYLKGYELRIAGLEPTSLAANAQWGDAAAFQLANPDIRTPEGRLIPKELIGIRWSRMLAHDPPVLHDVLTFTNFALQGAELPVSLAFAASFEDIFAVRGLFTEQLGKVREPRWRGDSLVLSYDGKDGRRRSTTITFSRAPAARKGTAAVFHLRMQPRETLQIEVTVRLDEAPEHAATPTRHPRSSAHAAAPQRDRATHATVQSGSLLLNEIVERSFGDLQMLRTSIDNEEFFAAGIPWFGTLFGRDSIITSLQTLAYEPRIAEQTARLLAHFQGHEVDEWRDEQPGKILHSIRVGEMARLGEIPHTPYYGSVDATPLFLILIARHAEWTGSLSLFHDLRENVERALEWMSRYGDLDGDGYIEYASTSQRGLINQGWKDSGDAIVDSDGHLGAPPIALVEVQGYAYLARTLVAELYERAGDTERADQLRRAADTLRERFNRDFWMEEHGCYALALEAGDKPISVISSNPGHALWSGIADADKARRTAERLMQGDMFSGWGVRTLSQQEVRYNPVGYHLGTVWPHDNSIIAAGFRRYGCDEHSHRILMGLIEAAMHFEGYRLPELFAGFSRDEYPTPVRFPVACHPQAWASGSIPYLLVSLLGLTPDAFNRRLRVVRPMLPALVGHLDLDDIAIADARVSLRFECTKEGTTAVMVLDTKGEVEVLVEPRGG